MSSIKKSDRKNLFSVDTAVNFRIVVFVLLSLGMMTLDHRKHYLDGVRDVLATLIYPLQYLVQLPTDASSWVSSQLASRSELLSENARLKQQQFYLDVQLQKLTALEAENRRLRMLLQSSVNRPERALIAELLSVDFDPYRHRILLNKGTRDGVFVGQPLIDQLGIVGQIVHANTLSSQAILITDPNHLLPVEINRNGLRALAAGTGNFKELELLHVRYNEDVKVGDLLITSGLGGRFPRGYPVARITRVDSDPGHLFAHIIAQPTSQLDRIREVLLLVDEPQSTTNPSPDTGHPAVNLTKQP